jgi:hypothetical protein
MTSRANVQFILIIFIATLLVLFAAWKIGMMIKKKFFSGILGHHHHADCGMPVACDGTPVAMEEGMEADMPAASMDMNMESGEYGVGAGPMEMSMTAGGGYDQYMY